MRLTKNDPVVNNIRSAVEKGTFNVKVEVGEPDFSSEEKCMIVREYFEEKRTLRYRLRNSMVNAAQNMVAYIRNWNFVCEGMENLEQLQGKGAIITSNHFNPLENTAILRLVKKAGRKRKLYAVSQITNFAMPGTIGFLLRYANVVPICMESSGYMADRFENTVSDVVNKDNFVLIYPEQEMWYNYRKPRPPKVGAYYFAAKLGLPVLPCFVEIRDQKVLWGLWRTKYVLHVMPVIYPDTEAGIRKDAEKMMEKDYGYKKEAYEKAYGKPLDYTFDYSDIAGIKS